MDHHTTFSVGGNGVSANRKGSPRAAGRVTLLRSARMFDGPAPVGLDPRIGNVERHAAPVRLVSLVPLLIPTAIDFSRIDRGIGSGESGRHFHDQKVSERRVLVRKPDKVGKPGRHGINWVPAIRDVFASGGVLSFKPGGPRSKAGGRGLRERHGGEYARPPP
jgi:protein gp37